MATPDPNEKVLVHISWSERVRYDSTVSMTRAAFEKFEKLWLESDEDDNDVDRALAHVDRDTDWVDDGDREIDEFELAVTTE